MFASRRTVARLVVPTIQIILLGVLPVSSALAVDWTQIPLGTTNDLLDIELGGWAVATVSGRGGFLANTFNPSLAAWNTVSTPTGTDLQSVMTPATAQIWVGGIGGVCQRWYVSSWTNVPLPDASQDYVFFSNASLNCRAAGSHGSIYYWGDGYTQWGLQASGTTAALHCGVDGSPAMVVGDGGTMVSSADGGVHWTPVTSGTSANLYSVIHATSSLWFAVGSGGTILRSTDLTGATWTQIPSGTTATLHDVSAQAGTVVAVGDGGIVLKSTDAGLTWCPLSAGVSTNLRAVGVRSDLDYLVAGDGGLLLHTTNGGGPCGATSAPVVASVEACSLSGPRPSPMSSSGVFAFAPARDGDVDASLFDVAGRHVATLFSGRVSGGAARRVDLDARRFTPGVYFLRVRGPEFQVTKRLVVSH
ncbi:MAG: hypothetical protein U0167_09735 [bacterium]